MTQAQIMKTNLRAAASDFNLEPMIIAKNLTKKYKGICAVEDLNLNVVEGEIFGFLGPNGAGKTTTIRVLTTLAKSSSGSVCVSGFGGAFLFGCLAVLKRKSL